VPTFRRSEELNMSATDIERAVGNILHELAVLKRSGKPKGLTDKLVRETIFYLFEGGEAEKWSYDRPHSAAARALHDQCRAKGLRFSGSRSGPWPVTYEHAIPLTHLQADILEAAYSRGNLIELLRRRVCGVIITNEENERLNRLHRATMPSGADTGDLMARYRAAGITFMPDDERRLLARGKGG
jgi:hypothetical protein